jgi:drug/metabolite transporter (DMT)-like permease
MTTSRPHHEIPTHLNVEDRVLFGLTVRQLLYLMVGCSVSYGLWERAVQVGDGARLALAAACLLVAAAFALVRPLGRPLEEWLVAGVCFVAAARTSTWRPAEPRAEDWRPAASDWQELMPTLDWQED